jgi:hypothetical protein
LARAELLFHRLLGSTIMMATRPAHVIFPGFIISEAFTLMGWALNIGRAEKSTYMIA